METPPTTASAEAPAAVDPAGTFATTVDRLIAGRTGGGNVLADLMRAQCHLAGAERAALLQVDTAGAVGIVKAIPALPPAGGFPHWLALAMDLAPRAAREKRTIIEPADDGASQPSPGHAPAVIIVPLGGRRSQRVAAYLVPASPPEVMPRAAQRLEIAAPLLRLHDQEVKLRARDQLIGHLRGSIELLEAVNEQDRFAGATMSFCNEVAAQWKGERVSLGLHEGRYVKLAAISSAERFDRRMKLVQDIETAMEECLDQDTEIVHPRPESAIYLSRATEQLAGRDAALAVASLPLRHHGRPVGVVTIERRPESPLTGGELEILRLVCELVTPRLLELRQRDRWIGVRAAVASRRALAVLLGPKHTTAKLAAIAVMAFLAFTIIAKGPDRIDASFQIEAVTSRIVAAPFDGRIEQIEVEPGDEVRAGETVLARLETAELQMELAAARAERAAHVKEADLALRDGKTVDLQIAQAELRRAEADIRLLEHRLSRAEIVAPIDGTVIEGELRRQVGAPVETGAVLFEVAALEVLRAELHVPEDRIADLMNDDGSWSDRRGRLASVASPGDYIAFAIEHVNPVAETIDNRNVFLVRVRLLEDRSWLRPGMKGVAKVDVGRAPHAILWTRPMISWLRTRLWI